MVDQPLNLGLFTDSRGPAWFINTRQDTLCNFTSTTIFSLGMIPDGAHNVHVLAHRCEMCTSLAATISGLSECLWCFNHDTRVGMCMPNGQLTTCWGNSALTAYELVADCPKYSAYGFSDWSLRIAYATGIIFVVVVWIIGTFNAWKKWRDRTPRRIGIDASPHRRLWTSMRRYKSHGVDKRNDLRSKQHHTALKPKASSDWLSGIATGPPLHTHPDLHAASCSSFSQPPRYKRERRSSVFTAPLLTGTSPLVGPASVFSHWGSSSSDPQVDWKSSKPSQAPKNAWSSLSIAGLAVAQEDQLERSPRYYGSNDTTGLTSSLSSFMPSPVAGRKESCDAMRTHHDRTTRRRTPHHTPQGTDQ